MNYIIGEQKRADYQNITPAEFSNIKTGIDNLIFEPPLNIMFPQDIYNFISALKTKVCGNICFNFIDIREVCFLGYRIGAEIPALHGLTLGMKNEYKSIIDMTFIRQLMEKMELKIEKIYREESTCRIYVEVRS